MGSDMNCFVGGVWGFGENDFYSTNPQERKKALDVKSGDRGNRSKGLIYGENHDTVML